MLAQSASRLTAAAESYGAIQLEQKVIVVTFIFRISTSIIFIVVTFIFVIFININSMSTIVVIVCFPTKITSQLSPQMSPAIEVTDGPFCGNREPFLLFENMIFCHNWGGVHNFYHLRCPKTLSMHLSLTHDDEGDGVKSFRTSRSSSCRGEGIAGLKSFHKSEKYFFLVTFLHSIHIFNREIQLYECIV